MAMIEAKDLITAKMLFLTMEDPVYKYDKYDENYRHLIIFDAVNHLKEFYIVITDLDSSIEGDFELWGLPPIPYGQPIPRYD